MRGTGISNRGRPRHRRRCVTALTLLGVLLLQPVVATTASAAAADPGPGFVDFGYDVPGGPTDATSFHTQSKTWFQSDHWWSILFRPDPGQRTGRWLVHRLDGQEWTSTGVEVDNRANVHMDTLRDGTDVFVVSSDAAASQPVRVYRLALVGGTYAVSAVATTKAVGVRFATVAEQGGRLWVAYTQSDAVWTMSSTDRGAHWSAPRSLDLTTSQRPAAGTPGATSGQDDVAVITPVGSGVGILWNAGRSGFYFAADTANTDTGWGTSANVETAWKGPYVSDNHLSVRTTADGRVLAAVKTSLNDPSTAIGTDPLIAILERAPSGTWRSPANTAGRNVSQVSQDMTRPTLVIDEEHQQAHVLFSDAFGGRIYRRVAPLDTLDFGSPSVGEGFIDSRDHPHVDDATSTRDPVDAQSGLLVLASDQVTRPRTYLHGCLGGPGCPRAAQVPGFTASPTSGPLPLVVRFSDTSTGSPTTRSWDFGDGSGPASDTAPTHTYDRPGSYQVVLTATYPAGQLTAKQTVTVATAPSPPQLPPGSALPASTRTTLSVSPSPSHGHQRVRLRATVTGTGAAPRGTITFLDGSHALGRPVAVASGAATRTVSSLGWGTHALAARFTPTTPAFSASISRVTWHVVEPPGSRFSVLRRPHRMLAGTTVRTGHLLDVALHAPPGATAVAVNVTAVGGRRPAVVAVCSGGTPRNQCGSTPLAHVPAGKATAAFAVVKIGRDGRIRLAAGRAAVRAGLDVVGWFVRDRAQAVLVRPAGPPVQSTVALAAGTPTRWRLPARLRSEHPVAVRLRLTVSPSGHRSVVTACHPAVSARSCRATRNVIAYRGAPATNEVITPVGRRGALQLLGREGARVRVVVVGLYRKG